MTLSLLGLFITVTCAEYFLVRNVHGEDCRFTWPNETELNTGTYVTMQEIRDDEKPGTIVLSLRTQYVENIIKVTNHNNLAYIEPTLADNSLTLALTEDFQSYEEQEITTTLSVTITFGCMGGVTRDLEFVQVIEDINNHSPEFSNTPYNYKLPMPFPNGLVLGYVYAHDIDMTNTNITFYLDETNTNVAGLTVTWLSRDPVNRNYSALLATKSVINFLNNVTFALCARDSPPAGTSSTTCTDVSILVDRKNSVLRFASPLYTADLKDLTFDDANGKIINFAEGEIGLNGGTDGEVTYGIQDEFTGYGSNFEILRSDDPWTVQIRLKDVPEKFFEESVVVLILTAKISATTESTIIYLSLRGSAVSAGNADETSSDVPAIVLGVLLAAVTASLIVILVGKYGCINHLRSKSSRQ